MLKGVLSIEKKVSAKNQEYQVIYFTDDATKSKIELGTEYSNPQAIAKVLMKVLELQINTK